MNTRVKVPHGTEVSRGKSALARIVEFLMGGFFLTLAAAAMNEPNWSGWAVLFFGVMGLAAIGAAFSSHEKV